jgi:hypothetical protein
MKTPLEHMAEQYEAAGRRIDARRVRQGRLNVGERILLRAISAAQIEATAARVRMPKGHDPRDEELRAE